MHCRNVKHLDIFTEYLAQFEKPLIVIELATDF